MSQHGTNWFRRLENAALVSDILWLVRAPFCEGPWLAKHSEYA